MDEVNTIAPTSSATLLVELPDGAKSFALTPPTMTIGRDARCDISIDHPTVSRLHARLTHGPQGWMFEDLGSRNGTRLDRATLDKPMKLQPGAPLRIGRINAFFFIGNTPHDWKVDASEQHGVGRMVRCLCGRVGFIPESVRELRQTCVHCGRILEVEEPVAPANEVSCSACHTTIAIGQQRHTCPECQIVMHEDCWRENGGCATYGCAQANVIEPPPSIPNEPRADTNSLDNSEAVSTSRKSTPAVRSLIFGLVSLLLFGVPAVAYGVFELVRPNVASKQRVYGLASILFGSIGFLVSGWWWLGWERLR